MAKTYAELVEQANALMREAEALRLDERKGAIEQVKKIMAENDLTLQDIGGRGRAASANSASPKPVAPKYRDSATGQTWSGRGKRPRWVAAHIDNGGSLESLAIKAGG